MDDATRVLSSTATGQSGDEQRTGFLDSCPAIVYAKSTAGRYVWVNHQYETVWRLAKSAIIGKTDHEIFPKESADLFLAGDRQALEAGHAVDLEQELQCADGPRTFLQLKVPAPDPATGAPLLWTFAIDITGRPGVRRGTEEALRESRRFIERVAETVPYVLYVYDIREHRLVYVNRQIGKVLSYTPQEVADLGPKLIETVVHPEDLEHLRTQRGPYEEAAGGEILETELRVKNREGEWRWLYTRNTLFKRDTAGRPQQFLGTAQDITEYKLAQERAKRERDFTSAVLDTARALVVVLDPEGRIVRFNRACERATGYTAEEVSRKVFWELLVPAEEAEGVRLSFEKLVAGEAPREHEGCWVTKDGERRLIAWSDATLSGGGLPEFVIRTGIDITERRRTEQAVRENEAALQHSHEQLRALTARLLTAEEEEARRVSRELHDDLNQRLAAFSIELETLERQLPESRKAIRDRLRSIRRQSAALAEDVRQMARQLHPSILDELGLRPALRSYCADFSKRERIRVKFVHTDVPDAIPPDVALCLYRVTQECLANIARHSGASHAAVMLSGASGEIHLRIKDYGSGFVPGEAKGKGGLGIASMEERVRLVQGTMSIDSYPARGTEVEFRIPLSGRTP